MFFLLLTLLLGWSALGFSYMYLMCEAEVIPEPTSKFGVWALAWIGLPVITFLFLSCAECREDPDRPTVGEFFKFLLTMQDTEDEAFTPDA